MPAFDPYHKWLGIPTAEQPPSHYRLLGISPSETDDDVIAAAADQRMDYLHSFSQGDRGPDARRLMDEIARASMCLLDPKRRAAYEATLRSRTLPPTHSQPVPQSLFNSAPKAIFSESAENLVVDEADAAYKPKRKNRGGLYFWLWNLAVLVAIIVLAVVIGLRRQNDEGDAVADNDSPANEASDNADSSEGAFLTDSGDDDAVDSARGPEQVATMPANPDTRPNGRPPRQTQPRTTTPRSQTPPMNEPDSPSAFPIQPPDKAILFTPLDEPPHARHTPPGLRLPTDAAAVRQVQEQWSEAIGWELELVNTIEMPLVLIPPGEFEMGGWTGNDRTAQTQQVSISTPLYMGRHEVTQQEWRKVMGEDDHPSFFSYQGEGSAAVQGVGTNRFPVESITWFEAIVFCNALSQLEMLDAYYQIEVEAGPDGTPISKVVIAGGTGYRLPTEAEWEYVCRAGTTTAFDFGEADAADAESFNSSLAGVSRTAEVESYSPNAFGLFDMHGNAWEWCYDWFDQFQVADDGPLIDPVGPEASIYSSRLIRGGSYISEPDRCMSISRAYALPEEARRDIGLRIVRTLEPAGDRESSEPAIAGTEDDDLPKNLLDAVHAEMHADSRPWERTDAGIVADNLSGASFLTVPGYVPEQYDLSIRLTIEREEADPGSDVHISLPQARGARGGRLAFPFVIRRIGSDTLLSFWPSDPTTGEFGVAPLGVTLAGENPFAAGATITFQVRGRSITVLLDEEQQFVFGFGSAISSEMPMLKLGSWQNRVVFHSAVLMPFVSPEN